MRRKAIEELDQRKIAMISALYANTNYNSSEGRQARTDFIEAIEENNRETVLRIYGADAASDVWKIEEDDPFFNAMNVPDDVKKEAFT